MRLGACSSLRCAWQASASPTSGPGRRAWRAAPAGEQAIRLRLAGVCLLLLAALGAGPGQAIFRRAAGATTRSLLDRAAEDLARGTAGWLHAGRGQLRY